MPRRGALPYSRSQARSDASSSSIPITRATRSMSASWANSVASRAAPRRSCSRPSLWRDAGGAAAPVDPNGAVKVGDGMEAEQLIAAAGAAGRFRPDRLAPRDHLHRVRLRFGDGPIVLDQGGEAPIDGLSVARSYWTLRRCRSGRADAGGASAAAHGWRVPPASPGPPRASSAVPPGDAGRGRPRRARRVCLRPNPVPIHDGLHVAVVDLDVGSSLSHTPIIHKTCKSRV